MSVKNYPNVAAMQRTGKATGGRVKRRGGGGGPGRVGPKRLVAPKWRPDASWISGRHQRDYQAALRGNARARTAASARGPGMKTGGKVAKATGGRVKKGHGGPGRPGGRNGDREPVQQYSAQGYPLRVVGRSSYHSDAREALRKTPPPKSIRDIKGIGPGMKTGGKVAKATGGRVKKQFGGRQAPRGRREWDTPVKGGIREPLAPGVGGIKITPAQRRRMAAQRSLRRSPPPKRLGATGPGYKKGGRATRAKGGKAKR